MPVRARLSLHLIALLAGAVLFSGVWAGPATALGGGFPVAHSQNMDAVPRWDILEITFAVPDPVEVENPLRDVDLVVRFTGPDGKEITVGGFYFDQNLWKARFAPALFGRWSYQYTLRTALNSSASGRGEFTCLPSENPGFVRQSPRNPYLWVFDNGDPHWPIGLQDCVGPGPSGDPFESWALEGGDRRGPWHATGTDADAYLATYAQAGFNLFRFSQQNCSYSIYDDLDHYRTLEAVWTDELLDKLRHHGYRIFYGFIGYGDAYIKDPDNADAMAKVKRFLKYSVDRWGAYVDFWELLNEQNADPRWTTMMAEYVRSIDPYHHPITDWEAEKLLAIDFNSPHWYERELEEGSDAITAENAKQWKLLGKPVIVGEQGNDQNNWDYHSARRMRFRIWGALFNEISFIFWNTSYALNGHYMNIYLGPEERQYVRALQNFTTHLDAGMKMTPVARSSTQFRAYGLASAECAAVYLHNRFGKNLAGTTITLQVPKAGHGHWLSPEDLRLLGSFPINSGEQTITLPDFRQDLALLIIPELRPGGPPMPLVDASPRFGIAPQTVVFDALKSTGACGRKIVSYQWSFGDGTAARGPTVSHEFQAGDYLATLTVSDEDAREASASLVVRVAKAMVTDRPPVVDLTADPAYGPAPLSVRFHATVSPGTAGISSYRWDFGDGQTVRGSGEDKAVGDIKEHYQDDVLVSLTLDVVHVYAKPGTYQATVTVLGQHDNPGRASAILTVQQPLPA